MNQHNDLILHDDNVINISLNTNNYRILSSLVMLNPTVNNIELTGIKLPESSKVCKITVANVHATNSLILKHNSGSSDSDARITIDGGIDYVLVSGKEVSLTWKSGSWKLHTETDEVPNNNTISFYNNGTLLSNKAIKIAIHSVTAGNTTSKSINISANSFSEIFGVWAISERNSNNIGEIDNVALRSVTTTTINYNLTRSSGLVTILTLIVDGSEHDITQTNTVRFLIIGA